MKLLTFKVKIYNPSIADNFCVTSGFSVLFVDMLIYHYINNVNIFDEGVNVLRQCQ